MTETLQALIESAKKIAPSSEQLEQQRRSFAYGNTHFENGLITREMVNEQADKLVQQQLSVHVTR